MAELADVASPPGTYYAFRRDDVLRLIPPGTRTLLDVGCGDGTTAASAKERFSLDQVVGVEAVERAARAASKKLDRVIQGDIETLSLDFSDGYFDCMVFADVLEHLREPGAVLKKLRRHLNDDGVVVASIPNIRNTVTLVKIITDTFEYEDAGILDRTHLRFFTLHTMKLMFREAGFTIVKIVPNRYTSWRARLVNLLSLGLMRQFSVWQYVLVAVKDNQTGPSA